ncbi:MAG: phosphoribosylglycinamide formyltransferase [Spirochaetaceae bacterium]
MANIAILASGSGSNFQALSKAIKNTQHSVKCLICDRKNAFVFNRAKELGIKAYYVTYYKRDKNEAETEINNILIEENVDLVVLAGFMRLISPLIINKWENKIINIHPALLPKYPGSHGIEESFNSGDDELGITIHYVDKGMDTGPIIYQESFKRQQNETLESIENNIHVIEHRIYPEIVINKLDELNKNI